MGQWGQSRRWRKFLKYRDEEGLVRSLFVMAVALCLDFNFAIYSAIRRALVKIIRFLATWRLETKSDQTKAEGPALLDHPVFDIAETVEAREQLLAERRRERAEREVRRCLACHAIVGGERWYARRKALELVRCPKCGGLLLRFDDGSSVWWALRRLEGKGQ